MALPRRSGLLPTAALLATGVAVKVDFYGQAGCSHCYAFMTGALKRTLSLPGFAGMIDFEYYPWGNAYFVTSKCRGGDGYDILSRKCYDANCGRGAGSPLPDCFGPGAVICQNGANECEADRYVACAKMVVSKDFIKYLPFAQCVDKAFEGNPHAVNVNVSGLAASCAATAGLDFVAISGCFAGPEGDGALTAEAMATPPHGFCPVVVVDGQEMEWGTEGHLLDVVCARFPDPVPEGCRPPALFS